MSLFVPILILLVGALLVAVGARLGFRYTPIVQAIMSALALAALVGSGGNSQMFVILAWRPVSLFGMPIVLNVDSYAWALCLTLLITVLVACLRWLAQPQPSRFYPALVLAATAIMLAAVSAANLLTLVLAWGFLDVVYCLMLLGRGGRAGSRRTELVVGIYGMATLSAWVAMVFLEQDGSSSYWYLMSLPTTTQALLGLAALLRLGLYPSYAWSMPESESEETSSPPALLNLMPILAGLALWIRLAVIQAAPIGGAWVWIALLGALLAGLLAWAQLDARRSISHVAIGYVGLLIAAGSGAGLSAAHLTLGAVAWLLGVYLLAISPSFDFRFSIPLRENLRLLWNLPALVALATLLGLPLTAGMEYRLAMQAGLAEANGFEWVMVVLTEMLLACAALRYALAARPAPLFERRLSFSASIAALAVATLALIILGVWPAIVKLDAVSSRASSARGWVGWVLPVIGTILVFAVATLRATGKLKTGPPTLPFASWGKTVTQVLDLSWFYDLFTNSLRRAARLIGGVAVLIEGKAALVWTLLIIVLALLYLREPGR